MEDRDKVVLVLSAAAALTLYKTYMIKKQMRTLDMKVNDVKKRLDIAIQIEVDRRFKRIVEGFED